MLTPHMKVLHKEIAYARTLMKKYSHISTHDGLVNLFGELGIQYKSLEVVCNDWDEMLKIIMEINKSFFNKHIVIIPSMK